MNSLKAPHNAKSTLPVQYSDFLYPLRKNPSLCGRVCVAPPPLAASTTWAWVRSAATCLDDHTFVGMHTVACMVFLWQGLRLARRIVGLEYLQPCPSPGLCPEGRLVLISCPGAVPPLASATAVISALYLFHSWLNGSSAAFLSWWIVIQKRSCGARRAVLIGLRLCGRVHLFRDLNI